MSDELPRVGVQLAPVSLQASKGSVALPVCRVTLHDSATADATSSATVGTAPNSSSQQATDRVAVEAALQIRISGEPVASTLRTPGHDRELALGLLYNLGVVCSLAELSAVYHCGAFDTQEREHTVEVRPAPGANLESDLLARLPLQATLNSACGACGSDLSQLTTRLRPVELHGEPWPVSTLLGWVQQLTQAQHVFAQTGGLHAAAAASLQRPLVAFEDVGRHNAVDKVVGHLLLASQLPARDQVLLVTSRAGFEIVHKACMAGFGTVVCLSAATSLAVELARQFNLTLVGFMRAEGFTIYSVPERISTQVC